MPSLDELGLPLDIDETTLDVGAPEDVLAAVKTEGRRRRVRRHRRNTVIAMFGVALLAAPALALLPDGGDDQVTVASDDGSTTTEQPSSTVPATTETTVLSTETTIGVATVETATTIPGTRPTPAPTTTVPPLQCRNSTNPACGAFRWDPAPANADLALTLRSAPTSAVVGQPAEFVVDWSDPDSADVSDYVSDGEVFLGTPCGAQPQRYGPWDPPAPQPGSGTRTLTHTFTSAGDNTVTIGVFSGDGCANPYASANYVVVTVTVTEAPAS